MGRPTRSGSVQLTLRTWVRSQRRSVLFRLLFTQRTTCPCSPPVRRDPSRPPGFLISPRPMWIASPITASPRAPRQRPTRPTIRSAAGRWPCSLPAWQGRLASLLDRGSIRGSLTSQASQMKFRRLSTRSNNWVSPSARPRLRTPLTTT